MVGYDSKSHQLSVKHTAMAGCLSSICTRAAISPLDIVKIRLQLSTKSASERATILHTAKDIYKSYGLRTFWKGHIPAQCMGMIYGVLQMPIYEKLTEYSSKNIWRNEKATSVQSFICGGIAAAITNFIVHPVDTVRVVMVAQIGSGSNNGTKTATKTAGQDLLKCISSLKSSDKGLFSLYRGILPGMIQVMPYNALVFYWVNIYQKYITNNSLAYGFLGGSTAKLITYPLDVLKKRLQVANLSHNTTGKHSYTGLVNCAKTMVKQEGVLSLYKGSTIAIAKSGLTMGLIFFTYNAFREIIYTTIERKSEQR